jgi:hypothetical protein
MENDAITLREYIDDKLAALKCYYEARFSAIDKAYELSSKILDGRLENMNRFREENKENTNNFVTRREHELMMNNYDSRLRELEISKAKNEGKASQSSVMWAYGLSVVSMIIGIIAIIEKALIK